MDDFLQRIRTYPSPPADFDPHTAADHALRRHGLPRRPDPDREPHLARHWQHGFSEPITFVEAELAIETRLAAGRARHRAGSRFAPQGWSGIIRVQEPGTDYAQPSTFVSARWVVPDVLELDPAGMTDLTVGFWVGLDGEETGELLQAGVAAIVEPGYLWSDVEWFAWTEWFTGEFEDPAVRVTNFPVAAGDTVAFTVCAPQPDFGFIAMANLTRHHASSIGIPARPGIMSGGKTAEWIVEGISADLPAFEPITFTDCVGGSDGEVFSVLPGGRPVNMVGDHDFNPLTQSFATSESSVMVKWHDFD